MDTTNWCSVWLLLNNWIERGVVVPETWTPERLARVVSCTAWSPPHLAALAEREAAHGHLRFHRALLQTWCDRKWDVRWTDPTVRITYAEAKLTVASHPIGDPMLLLDFHTNYWNSQMMLCAFVTAERYEARVAAEGRLSVGDTTVLPPALAVSLVIDYLPAHVRDLVALTIREPVGLIRDHAGLPFSHYHTLLGYLILALRFGVSAHTVGVCMWSGWPDRTVGGLSTASVLAGVLDDDDIWNLPESGIPWRFIVAVLLLYRYQRAVGASTLGSTVQVLLRRQAGRVFPGVDQFGCGAVLADIVGQPPRTVPPQVRGAASAMCRALFASPAF